MRYKIQVDSSCDILYSSYYIRGLYEVFQKKNVHFTRKGFEKFSHNNNYFAFKIIDDKSVKKFIIDFGDSDVVDGTAYDWCDHYGKVNLNARDIHKGKILAIGPSFGIKIFGLSKTVFYSVLNFLKSYRRIKNKKRFFSDYKAQYNRLTLREYYPNSSKESYVYFMSSLWKKEEKTNELRANFIKACKQNILVNFEGGFAPRSKNDIVDYLDLVVDKRVTLKDYIEKMKKTSVCFNTPAVLECHGWKLAEYLCLGKPIISTSFTRELPKPIVDQTHLLFTNGTQEDLHDKITAILKNSELSITLGKNARNYYETELAPSKVIERLVGSI